MAVKIHATKMFKTAFTSRGGGPVASKHNAVPHWTFYDYLLQVDWIEYELNLRIEYHAIHKGSKGDDQACLKVDDQVSFGSEGGWEEAEESGAAEVGDDQGDQAEKRLGHPFKFFFIINALGFGRLLIAFENLDVTLPAESFILSSEEDWLCIDKFDIPSLSIPSHSSLLMPRTITFFI